MKRLTLLLGAALAATPLVSPAKDFPLEFKTLPAQEAMSFPSGSGLYGQLHLQKPPAITKEPAAVSRHPLYGQLGSEASGYVFRIDESKGDGKGYDQLIVDLNRNGDLTDETAAGRVAETNTAKASPVSQPERAFFGPILAPPDKKIGDWQPVYFAQAYVYLPPGGIGSAVQGAYLGQLRLKAGWYLEAAAEFDGVKRQVAVADGNCNFRLGDLSTPTTYQSDGQTNWYFQIGDTFLQDTDNSGKFQSSPMNPKSAPFFPMVYADAKPYKITLAADCRALAVEPWTEPLAEIAVQPHGEQVSSVQLALESTPGQWQLLQASVTEGKTRVPPGNYRLYACTIKTKTATGDTLILSGSKRLAEGGTRCEAGQATPLKCGAPLEIKTTSERDTRNNVAVEESSTLLGRLVRSAAQAKPPVLQRIAATVVGVGGETYSGFVLDQKGKAADPADPIFTITAGDGKQVATGKMEFG